MWGQQLYLKPFSFDEKFATLLLRNRIDRINTLVLPARRRLRWHPSATAISINTTRPSVCVEGGGGGRSNITYVKPSLTAFRWRYCLQRSHREILSWRGTVQPETNNEDLSNWPTEWQGWYRISVLTSVDIGRGSTRAVINGVDMMKSVPPEAWMERHSYQPPGSVHSTG